MRAQRLLDLIQVLRRHRQPVTGAALADELGVSLRTLYRDIATLQAQGATIDGEPGIGYVLRPGFMLPPLMFSEDEIAALVLGSRWVADRADTPLGMAASNALAKIAAVLPPDLRDPFRALWDEFEAAETPDALFAKSLDRVQPVMANLQSGGGTWTTYNVTLDQLDARVGTKIARGAPRLWDWVREKARPWFG